MPEHALRYTVEGCCGSMMSENTSESSITPFLIWCQLRPPSSVFQARCHVPAYITSGFFGSIASDSIFLMSLWPSGEMRFQWSPPSSERNTPSSAPATRILGLEGLSAIVRTEQFAVFVLNAPGRDIQLV